MQVLMEKETVKEYFGVRQQYHSPVLHQQTRFYLIKIQNITTVSPILTKNINQKQSGPKKIIQKTKKSQIDATPKFKSSYDQFSLNQQTKQIPERLQENKKFQVTFQVGCRSSSQTMEIDSKEEKNNSKNQKIYQNKNKKDQKIVKTEEETQKFSYLHIFPFEKEEVMTVTFKNSMITEQYGYALMPLIPFIKMPQIKHQIEVQLVFFNEKKEIRNEIAAVLHISLYFLNGFKGNLIIQPVQANLGRNLAQFGQMSPIIRMFLRNNQFHTEKIQQGGVRPNWESSNKFCCFNIPIRSAFDQLFIYLFYNREVTMDEMIGYYKLDLQNQGLFKEGECLQKFIRQEQVKRKNDKKLITFEKQDSKLSILVKKKKGMNNDLAILNKTQKIYILGEQKRIQKQIYQLEWLYKQVQNERQDLINLIVKKVQIISSTSPPQIVNYKTDLIYKLYEQKEKQILQKFQEICKINVHEFVGSDLQQINKRSMTSLTGEQIKIEIRKMLIKQIKFLFMLVQQKMDKIEVPLLYTPVSQQGQDQKTVQIGRLAFKYFFLYQFQIPSHQDQEDIQNQTPQITNQ